MIRKTLMEEERVAVSSLRFPRPMSELKPLHNLPRGKKTWNPAFIKEWWFWPSSVLFLIALHHLYPLLWKVFSP